MRSTYAARSPSDDDSQEGLRTSVSEPGVTREPSSSSSGGSYPLSGSCSAGGNEKSSRSEPSTMYGPEATTNLA